MTPLRLVIYAGLCVGLSPLVANATNAVALLNPVQRASGVITHSSGNHGAALALASLAHALSLDGLVPYDKRRCDGCSLLDLCRPRTTGSPRSAAAWLASAVED